MPKIKTRGLRKRGNIWYIRVQQNGIRKDIPAGTDLAKALKLRNQYKQPSQLSFLKRQPVCLSHVTFSQAFDEYWINHMQYVKSYKAKDKCYLKGLEKAFGHRDIATITWQEFECYKHKRLAQVSASVVRKELLYAGAIYKLQMKLGTVLVNPLAMVERPRVQDTRERILTHEEFLKLLGAKWDYKRHGNTITCTVKPHIRLALVIADYTAMRMGEILRMTWDHVDLKNGIIHIPISKNGYKRVVPIHPELIKILESQKEDTPYVISYRKKPIKTEITTAVSNARKAAEIQDFRFHDLRHRAITRWVQEGKSIDIIRKVSGHRTYSAFSRYSNLKDGDIFQLVGRKTEPLPIVDYILFCSISNGK